MLRIILMLLLSSMVAGCNKGAVDPEPQRNLPPRAVETFEAQTLTVEREVLTVSFATSFNDPEGEDLTYTATSSNPMTASAAISGTDVRIIPLAAGSATVTVRATDPSGNSASVSISVTVLPAAHPDDDETYIAMLGLNVGLSRVSFFELSTNGSGTCIEVDPQRAFGPAIGSTKYQFHNSRWQRMDEYGWTTVSGTERSDNRLCTYIPTLSGIYRLVGEATVSSQGTEASIRFSSENALIY